MFINDTFTTFQGTGHLSGVRQFFVRFAGCSVACPIRSVCDEPEALKRAGSSTRTAKELVDAALEAVGQRGWMHITGGEPTDQSEDLQLLVMLARKSGLYVHLQTSGVRRVPVQWDWLTVSPKIKVPEQKFGQEMIVIDDGTVRLEWLAELRATTSYWSYYLCPVWGRDPSLTASLAAKAGWDLTCQAHKYMGLR